MAVAELTTGHATGAGKFLRYGYAPAHRLELAGTMENPSTPAVPVTMASSYRVRFFDLGDDIAIEAPADAVDTRPEER